MTLAAGSRTVVLALAGILTGFLAASQRGPAHREVRVLLGSVKGDAALPAGREWHVSHDGHRLASGVGTPDWSVERSGTRLRLRRGGSAASPWVDRAVRLDGGGDAAVSWLGKEYRGSLTFTATDTALLVVNHLEVEDYLRGVLPLEIGARQTDDHAAVEAQAVAARSFTHTRMAGAGGRVFDLTATDADQVYGGIAVETFWGDLAVAATAGLVLSQRGQVVAGPYHSACGGATAAPSETWRGGQDGFLRSVDDTNPRSGQPWCAIAPRNAWERRVTRGDVMSALSLYGDAGPVPRGGARVVRDVRLDGLTASGRVRAVVLATDAGDIVIRGNDIRRVLRPAGGDLLPSTRFSLTAERDASGQLTALLLRGQGNGHGVGLCQWGAIARARAGEDFRAILKAYYPGADLTRAP